MKKLYKLSIVLFAAGFIGVTAFDPPRKPVSVSHSNIKGWKSLFDGKSLAGWHNFNKPGEVKNWTIIDGSLVCLGATADATGGDIVTDKLYGNFELSWDWKIEKGSNSGVLYHVIEDSKYHTTYETGPEYQLIDDLGWPDKLEEWQKSGCDYAMHLPNDQKKLMPVGEWNTSKIIFNNGMWNTGSMAKRSCISPPGMLTGIKRKRKANGRIILITGQQRPAASLYRIMDIKHISRTF